MIDSIIRSTCLATLVMVSATGCRFDDRDATVIAQERLLVDGSWNTFSEAYYPGVGYEIRFLSLGMVARESGRMSESWAIREPNLVELTSGRDRTRRFRWFPGNILAYCHPGLSKPFLVAPDSMEYTEVLEAAKVAGVYNCDATTILTIAGAKIEQLADTSRTSLLVDVRGVELTFLRRAAIRRLTDARAINLSGVEFSDEDVSYLSFLDNLEEIDLSNTDVGDDGLTHLFTLQNLRFLDVSQTNVTPAGIRRIKASLPGLVVSSTSGTAHAREEQ